MGKNKDLYVNSLECVFMKITEIQTYAVGNPPPHHGGLNWVFLKLVTNNGIVGFGEAYSVPFNPQTTVNLIQDVGVSDVVGSDPFKIESLWRKLYTRMYTEHPDLTMLGVISAFEMACWDIIGKALDQPIYNLLGGEIP